MSFRADARAGYHRAPRGRRAVADGQNDAYLGRRHRYGGRRLTMRTEVAIVGAGPAGLLLSHLLAADGIDSVIVETRAREYVEARIRAGILEASTVELLDQAGLGGRCHAEGERASRRLPPVPGTRHHLDFVDLTGRSVWVYGQTEVTKDLGRAAGRPGSRPATSVSGTRRARPGHHRPFVTFTDAPAPQSASTAEVVAGCDGGHGPSRAAAAGPGKRTWERAYPYAWLGILADVAPSTDELIYAWHPDGFALHSMRSPPSAASTSRFPRRRTRASGPTTGSGTSPGHPARSRPGRLDAHRGADPREKRAADAQLRAGANAARPDLPGRRRRPHRPADRRQGLNLALADVALLAPALTALLRKKAPALADAYSERRCAGCGADALLLVDDHHAARGRRRVRRPAAAVPAALANSEPGRRGGPGRELRLAAHRLLKRMRTER